MINVMIVDDQIIVREGLKKILSLDDEIIVVCEAENGQEAIEKLSSNAADVILMDVQMPVLDGVKATQIIKHQYPHIKIILLTTFNESEYLLTGIQNGISGYLLKDSDIEVITKSIKDVRAEKMVFDPSVAPRLVEALNKKNASKPLLDLLTEQEKAVARLVAAGKSNREIAGVLFLSEGTVKNYISKILEKLNLDRRTQISAYILGE